MKKHLRMATLAFAATSVLLVGCGDDADDTTTDDTMVDDGAADDGMMDDGLDDDGMDDDAGLEEEG
jgi:hypothetical protein